MNGFILMAEFDEESHPLSLHESEGKALDTCAILTYNIVYSICGAVFNLPEHAVLVFVWLVEFSEGVPVARRKLRTV